MPDLSLGAACTQRQKRQGEESTAEIAERVLNNSFITPAKGSYKSQSQEILDCEPQLLSYSLWLNMTFSMIQTTDEITSFRTVRMSGKLAFKVALKGILQFGLNRMALWLDGISIFRYYQF
ncbi:hypothetical protein Q9966_008712 [Columba livia]|nr:hypothetical protein Q9966_008712 [Columba livia]